MGDKQVFAKIGVFLLVGINVAAYYYLWPHNDADKSAVQEAGQTELVPQKKETERPSEKPKKLPANTLVDAVPLSIPTPPVLPIKETVPTDPLVKLLDHIQREEENAKNVPPGLPSLPDHISPPAPLASKELEHPFGLPKEFETPPIFDGAAVARPIAPKTPRPWSWQTEQVGTQTLVIARLQKDTRTIEFRIVCDRVETKPDNTELAAIGKVALEGAGLRVTCGRVTLVGARLVFEEQVVAVQSAAGGLLRGERFHWEPAVNVPAVTGILGPPN